MSRKRFCSHFLIRNTNTFILLHICVSVRLCTYFIFLVNMRRYACFVLLLRHLALMVFLPFWPPTTIALLLSVKFMFALVAQQISVFSVLTCR
jgi:hypothetical protein